MDSDILTPQKTSFKVPALATPNEVDRESVQNKSLGFEWVVTSSQELPNLISSGNCCFSSA